MVENGTTIGRITPQETGEIDVENSKVGELLARVSNNWKVKSLLVPALLIVANLSRASELPPKVSSSEEVCFNKWELLGCATWGKEAFYGGPGIDDCSSRVAEQDGEFCVWSGPQGAPDPF